MDRNTELEEMKKELEALKNKTPKDESEIRLQLKKIGKKSEEQGKYNEALSSYKECLEIEKRILSTNHSDIASTLHNIGSVYDDQEKYEEALTYYNQSLEIYKQTLPSNHSSIAYTLNNIGLVYSNERKYEEALKYYNQSLGIYKQTLPTNHSSIGDTLYNIALAYSNQGKYEEALTFYNKSLEIYKQTLPSNHSSIAYTLNNIGLVYYNQGQYELALKHLTDEKQIEICRKKLKEQQENNNNPPLNNIEKILNQRVVKDLKIGPNEATKLAVKNNAIKDPYIGIEFNGRYVVKSLLGSGTYGRVYLVEDKGIQIDKAMKIMNQSSPSSETEMIILLNINHENIVRYFDHFSQQISNANFICVVTEYCEKGDLNGQIEKGKETGKIPDENIYDWIFQATNGLKYLHSDKIKIVHRDIKPANMLLTRNGVLKLADLGVAKWLEGGTFGRTLTGSPPYMSPEQFRCLFHKEDYSFPTDIWSLGCVLYELMFLKMAFPDGQAKTPEIPDLGNSLVFSAILRKMIVKAPEERIDSQKLYVQLMGLKPFLE